jgi:hypothetical protein
MARATDAPGHFCKVTFYLPLLCFSSRGAFWCWGAGAGLALGALSGRDWFCGREFSVRGALWLCDGDGEEDEERDALYDPLGAVFGRLLFCMRLLFGVDVLLLLEEVGGRLAAFEPAEDGRLAAEAGTRACLGEMAGA